MKHVFVESNFIIELVRPFPAPGAKSLFAREGTDVHLYVPWAAVVESKRTLDRIIREDLGFDDAMLKFGVAQLKASNIVNNEMAALHKLGELTKSARKEALKNIATDIDGAAKKMEVIEPTKEVVLKTLAMYQVKSLPPFDEMIMGAVLTHAAKLVENGETELFFCNLNKSDFDPKDRPELAAEYDSLKIQYLAGFDVPN